MKKLTIVFVGLLFVFVFAGAGSATILQQTSASGKTGKVTLEEARKIALKKVPGEVEDEYSLEDDDGEIDTYVFIVRKKDGKVFEVQIGASNGDVVSVEEFADDEGDGDPPTVFR